jgi:HNH endonuclease/NUMOD4 motif
MELWRPVVGFEGLYYVSNMGRIMSFKCSRTKILKTPKRKQYPIVCLVKDKHKTVLLVHRLVAKAFLDPIENKTEIDHIDRNPSNNRLTNLRYVTRSENAINRGPYSNTGHKNISHHHRSGWYHVVIRRMGVLLMNTAHPTLEEAIFQRDAYLDTE